MPGTAASRRRGSPAAGLAVGLLAGFVWCAGEWLLHPGVGPAGFGRSLLLDSILAGSVGALLAGPLRIAGGSRSRPAAALLGSVLLLVVVLGETGGLPTPRRSAPADRPDLVLVTLDTTRADRYWAVAAADRATDLERGSRRFTAVRTAAGLTAPAHASLFTGLPPSEHGLRNNGGVLARGDTLAARLRRAGYTTLAAPSVLHLDPGFGFGAGFDHFASCEGGLRAWLRPARPALLAKALLRLLGAGRPVRPGRETLAAARRLWLAAPAARPRFLWVHLFEPHWPYRPEGGAMAGPPWPEAPLPGFDRDRIAELRRLYDGEIRDVRRMLAPFLDALEADSAARGRRLVVVLTADHGEALGEHGASDHGDLPYEEGIRVPLWIRAPGLEPGEDDSPWSLTSVGLGLASWLAPESGPGNAFTAVLRGDGDGGEPIRVETDHGDFRNVAWIEEGRKLVAHARISPEAMRRKPVPWRRPPDDLPWFGPVEVYDLAADPLEQNNLFAPEAPGAAAASAQARELLAGLRPDGEPQPGVPPEVRRALAELGYLGGE
ncbi:MAG: hypothetical protein D6702_03080 [Planctomycetota bacterium]|nr:MAG: hypothetical protein D6702_03080 [Planctomycetota bacterium]